MNVLFLMIAYPDVRENTSMYTDLTQEFYSKGYNVFVAVANGPRKLSCRVEGGPYVLRVKTLELFSTSILKKGVANILLPYQVLRAIKTYFKGINFEAIIVSTPPITYISTVKRLRKGSKSKVYLILRDIFPQNARDVGIMENLLLFKYFRREEKKLYAISDFIGCMSPGNISYLKEHNPEIDQSKFHLLPNWRSVIEYSGPDIQLKRQFGLDNKFIVLYGGNFGILQKIEFIFDLAYSLKHIDDIVFLFVGGGTEKMRLTELALKMRLNSVVFMDSLPRIKYQELVKVCDIGLVNLNDKFTIPNIPSRTLSYWEAKIPILAALDKNTDFKTVLEQSGSGLWSLTGDIDSYKKNFEKLYSNKELRNSMGENGYNYLLENCTTSHAFHTIHKKLTSPGH